MTPGEALDQAFGSAPRADFLPEAQRRFADLDRPLPIGHGQTNSQPRTVRTMLALLDVRPGQRVLDVGCGSGWTTALLAALVGADGEVCGVEVVPELVTIGRANLGERPNATIVAATPGVLGLPEQAPFDRVLVSAEASTRPAALVDQLAEGGVLVIPVRGWLHEVRREGADVVDVRHGAYAFVPLVEG